jgi:hypothetical protein
MIFLSVTSCQSAYRLAPCETTFQRPSCEEAYVIAADFLQELVQLCEGRLSLASNSLLTSSELSEIISHVATNGL